MRSRIASEAEGAAPRLSAIGATARRRIATLRALLRQARSGPPTAGADPPLVTVIIAAYNWSSVLRWAVHSVLWQRHRNLELLVIGDACTDDSGEVVDSFGDPRARWINLPENVGNQTGPNNRGLELAQGRYVAYLGQDDVWHPDHLATLVPALERGDADVVYGLAEMLGPPGTRTRKLAGLSPSGVRRMGEYVPTPSYVHRAELGRAVGGWPDWRQTSQAPDTAFFDRLHASGARFARVPALTAFKFPSTARPNSYVERPSHEQEACVRRIEIRRHFLERELLALLARRLSPLPERPLVPAVPVADMKPGEIIRLSRRIRGLD